MALQPQVISVPLELGIDTKNSPVLLGQRSVALIQNVKFTKGANGQMVARNGYLSMSGTITAGSALAQLNGELDVIDSGLLKAYIPSTSSWVSRGSVATPVPSLTPLVSNSYNQSIPDAATLLGVTVAAWVDTRGGGVWFKVVDAVSGGILQAEAALSTVSVLVNPRVIALPATSQIAILASVVTATGVYAWFIDCTAPTVAPGIPATVVASTLQSTKFDAVYVPGGTPYICIVSESTLGYAQASTVNASTLTVVATGVIRASVVAMIACVLAGNGNFVVVSQLATSAVDMDFLTPSTLASVATFNIGAGLTNVYSGLAMVQGTASTQVRFYGNFPASGGLPAGVDVYQCDQSGGFAGSSGRLVNSAQMVSNPTLVNGVAYTLVALQSTVQPTYFLMQAPSTINGTSIIVGRYLALEAGQVPTSPRFTHAFTTATGIAFAVPVLRSLVSSGGTPIVLTGLDILSLDFTIRKLATIQLGQDLEIAGGLPQLYDGTSITENGWNAVPDAVTLKLLSSQIGLAMLSDGTSGDLADTVKQSFTITIPINQVIPGNDAALLLNQTEYVTIGGSDAFWFSVGGTQSAPTTLGSLTLHELLVPVNASATLIAFLLGDPTVGLINTVFSGTGFAATVAGNVVTVTATAAGAEPRPQTISQFNTALVNTGSGLSKAIVDVNCIPGNMIVGGQYFTFDVNLSGTDTIFYAWFSVSGVGADPTPAGVPNNPIPLTILSTDNESQVAAKLATQITAFTAAHVTATVINGPILQIQANANAESYYAPTNGTTGAGLGTVGGVATNQWDSYYFTGYYEAIDAQGQLSRSGPATPVQLFIPAYGYGNAHVQVTVSNLYLTARPTFDIVVERTIANGLIFYRDTSPTSFLFNGAGGLTQATYVDSITDAALQANEAMYTQPLQAISVLPNIVPQEYTQAAVFEDMLFTNDCENVYRWWPSKDFQAGVQVEWANQSITFDPTGGPTVTAIAMDTNLIVFAQSRIWAVSGFGPGPNGQGQAFQVSLVSSTIGCRDAGSVVLLQNGILFKSFKGWSLLDRALQTHYVGLEVEAYNSDVCVSAQVIPNTTEVRCLCASGTTLLYDYQYNQWGTFTNHLGTDSIVFGGAYYYLPAAGTPLLEDVGYYEDNSTGYPFLLKTAWLKPGAIQGFARVWHAYLQGMFPATNPVQVQIAYDYNPTVIDTFTLTPTADQIQIRISPSRQKCESMQFTIQDTAPWQSAKKMTLNAIDLELGLKKGGYKRLGNPGNL